MTSKLPRITAIFWITKILATTLGETGGDLVAQTLGIGYAVSSMLFLGVFIVALVTQLNARRFHPALYWTVIVATSTAGTTMSDFLNRTAGLGYAGGATVLIGCLAAVFAVWRHSGQTFAVERIAGFRGELLYWIAILFSNTLGTSLGDFLADDVGLGFAGGAMLIGVVMMLVLIARSVTTIPGPVLFWVAFVLTRPLGATVGDVFSKPHELGGLDLGTRGSTAVLVAILVVLVLYSGRAARNALPAVGPAPSRLAAPTPRFGQRTVSVRRNG